MMGYPRARSVLSASAVRAQRGGGIDLEASRVNVLLAAQAHAVCAVIKPLECGADAVYAMDVNKEGLESTAAEVGSSSISRDAYAS